jgi:hypothetical protein
MRREADKQNDGLKLKILTSKADPQMAVMVTKIWRKIDGKLKV